MKQFLLTLALSVSTLSPIAFGQLFPFPGPVPQSSGAFSGMGDINTTGALGGWSLRAWSTATKGNPAIEVCNVGDIACANMNSNATNGDLVITTVGGTDCSLAPVCTIRTFYDQTGAMNCSGPCDTHFNSATDRFVFITDCGAGRPCGRRPGGAGVVPSVAIANWSVVISQPYSASVVVERTGNFTTNATIFYLSVGATSGNFGGSMAFENSANTMALFSGAIPTFTANDNVIHAIQALYNSTSSNAYVDGTANTPIDVGIVSGGSNGQLEIGGDSADSSITGDFYEFGLWSGDQSANNAAMNANQHAYWRF